VKERDGGRCLCCGAVGDLVVNHRRSGHGHPQSGPQWLTTSCSGCNGDYEDRPLLAYAGGWKLPAGADPLAQPVRDHLGFWWLLDALGGRALVVAE
jgi:5-methylcytosine-specific restriction endonuclease McrA